MQFSRYISSFRYNGDGEIRTLDPLLARQVLSQLSYTPKYKKKGPALAGRYLLITAHLIAAGDSGYALSHIGLSTISNC